MLKLAWVLPGWADGILEEGESDLIVLPSRLILTLSHFLFRPCGLESIQTFWKIVNTATYVFELFLSSSSEPHTFSLCILCSSNTRRIMRTEVGPRSWENEATQGYLIGQLVEEKKSIINWKTFVGGELEEVSFVLEDGDRRGVALIENAQ